MAKEIKKAISCLDGQGLPKLLRQYIHESGKSSLWIICGNEYQQMKLGIDNKVHPEGEIFPIKENIGDMLLHIAEKKTEKLVGVYLRKGDNVDQDDLELCDLENVFSINYGGVEFLCYGFKPDGINISQSPIEIIHDTGNAWRAYQRANK